MFGWFAGGFAMYCCWVCMWLDLGLGRLGLVGFGGWVAWHVRFLRCGMVWLGLTWWEFDCEFGGGWLLAGSAWWVWIVEFVA